MVQFNFGGVVYMFRLLGFILLTVSLEMMQHAPAKPIAPLATEGLDGIYQFVSETADLTEPSAITTIKMAPQWEGIWLFQKGYYSALITEKGREAIYNNRTNTNVGAFAYAGKYQVLDTKLILQQEYAISPLEVNRSRTMEFKHQGDLLIFTQQLRPYMEDIRNGMVITVLKKVH